MKMHKIAQCGVQCDGNIFLFLQVLLLLKKSGFFLLKKNGVFTVKYSNSIAI